MANTHLRFTKPFETTDEVLPTRKWYSLAVTAEDARFPSSKVFKNPVSARFGEGASITNYGDDIIFCFTKAFTATFWAKFTSGAITDSLYPNIFTCIFDAENVISVAIPTTVSLTSWNFYTVMRDTDGIVYLKINGKTVQKSDAAITVPFHLTDGSSLFLGGINRYATGDEVIADDILLFSGVIWGDDFDATTEVTDYIDLSSLRHYLIIDTKTGAVYGRV